MGLQINGVDVTNVLINGTQVQELQLNGTTVWTSFPTNKQTYTLISGYTYYQGFFIYGYFVDGHSGYPKRYGSLSPTTLNGWTVDAIDTYVDYEYNKERIDVTLTGSSLPEKVAVIITETGESITLDKYTVFGSTQRQYYVDAVDNIPTYGNISARIKAGGSIQIGY